MKRIAINDVNFQFVGHFVGHFVKLILFVVLTLQDLARNYVLNENGTLAFLTVLTVHVTLDRLCTN